MKSMMFAALMLVAATVFGQDEDKSKRESPPAVAKGTLSNGTVITINYGQPSVKGRKIGVKLEPMAGMVWRTGANEATVFEVSKDVKIEGQSLPAGKYGLFTIVNGDEWTIIFNKTWEQWGAFKYDEAQDALRVKVKQKKLSPASEKLTFTIGKNGTVDLKWGDMLVPFKVS